MKIVFQLFQVCSNNDLVPLAKERVATTVEPWDYLKLRYSKEDGGVRTLLSDLSSLIKSIPTNLLVHAKPEDIGSIHVSKYVSSFINKQYSVY